MLLLGSVVSRADGAEPAVRPDPGKVATIGEAKRNGYVKRPFQKSSTNSS